MSLDNVKFRRPVRARRPAALRARDDPGPGPHLPDARARLRRRPAGGRGGDAGARGGPVTAPASTPPRSSTPAPSSASDVEVGPWAIVGPDGRGRRPLPHRAARHAASATCGSAPACSIGDGTHARRRPAGPQVSRRGDLGRDRRRHRHPRVLHHQPRHHGHRSHRDRRQLLPHDLRARGARLPRRRRRRSSPTPPSWPGTSRCRTAPSSAGSTRSTSSSPSASTPSSAAASRVNQDIPPYVKAVGNPIELYGLNTVGLQRAGVRAETVAGAQARLPARSSTPT